MMRFASLLVLLLVSCAPIFAGDEVAKKDERLSYDRKIQPVLSKYCFGCHNDEKSKGDINLQRDENPTLIANNRKVWSTVLQVLDNNEMPPKSSKKQPSDEERKLLREFVDYTLNHLDCDKQDDPGRPAVRRLNRTEYDNTVRALFGLEVNPAEHFSPDGLSYGFDTIADSLKVAPVQVQQYFDAAGKVLDTAFKDRAAYNRIVFEQPGPGKDGKEQARKVIAAFAKNAYRKPVDEAHIDQLMGIYDVANKAKKPFNMSVRAMMQAVLISPRFLMRVEDQNEKANGPYPVSSYDMASRLSYFIWSSPPDEELLKLASENKLQDLAVIEQQALRMVKDPRSRALAENFASQWLQLRNLKDHKPDAKIFPQFTESLREAMLQEAYLFIGELIRYDRPILDLLDANYTFLNEELANHYGISGVKGPRMQRVALTDRRRGGVVTMAATLTITADPGRTNIPRRGNYVMGTIFGIPPPPPPPDVPQLEAAKKDGAPKTLRETLEMHRKNPECASCHAKTDPLGFGLENFDAIGRWVETQEGKPIDASGVLPNGESFNGPVEMKRIMDKRKDDFARGMTESLLIYALGRGLIHQDECVVRASMAALQKDRYKFSALVKTMVTSYPFTHRRNAEF